MQVFDRSMLPAIGSSLKAGQYNLLLGSGVSLDARNKNGFLPSTDKFRLSLCELKGAKSSGSLQRVYSTLTPEEINRYVIPIFSHCATGPTLASVPKFLWRRIFTFNIDDALEDAYSKAKTLLQKSRSFNFSDPYEELSDALEVPIVHLHGWVRRPGDGFVFSSSEYVRQIQSINPWMVNLSQFLSVDPFIIAGASLDEVDLEFYLAHRSRVTAREDRGPSILVEPQPDAVTQTTCERHGVDLFTGKANEFFQLLEKEFPNRPGAVELLPVDIKSLFPDTIPKRVLMSFAADFEVVPTQPPSESGVSRFLFGYPPSWSDLAANVDIPRSITGKIIRWVERRLAEADEDDRILLIEDHTGYGKSTVLRRVAFECAQKGVRVLNCTPIGGLDP